MSPSDPPESAAIAATPPVLTATDLAAHIAQHAIQAELIPMVVDTPTVVVAAQALGVAPEQIVKSIVFLVDEQPYLVIACGLARIDQRRLADILAVGRKRVRLAPPDAVLALTGYPVGTMPPFGHARALPTFMDRGVLAQQEVFAGGGAIDYLLRTTPEELVRVTRAQVADVTEDHS
jgi:Cys-tRNA(Pro) deacylase